MTIKMYSHKNAVVLFIYHGNLKIKNSYFIGTKNVYLLVNPLNESTTMAEEHTWTCPECNRKFRVTNQPHSCYLTAPDHHFKDKPEEIRKIYDKIRLFLDGCGPHSVTFVKNAIIVSGISTFMAIKPRKEYIDIEFILAEESCEFPVHKTVRVSKYKVAHFVKLGSAEEFDGPVKNWIREAYELNMKRNSNLKIPQK
jgi:hypothetical protein